MRHVDHRFSSGFIGFPQMRFPDKIALTVEVGFPDISQFMRGNGLSNRVFKSYDDILDHCCFA
jgi:hypothetical protein